MNERMAELFAQATTIVEMVGPQGYTSSYANFDREKFAELIAQECARLAMTQHCSTSPADYGNMEPYEQGCDDTASRISGLIRRTFGVKE
jgi:hypothetical protein